MKTIDLLRDYFSTDELKNFNNGSTYKCFANNCYGAVSLEYLHEYLFKKRRSKRFIARQLHKLSLEKLILPIPCSFAGNLVFCTCNYASKRLFSKFSISKKGVVAGSYYEDDPFFKPLIDTFNSYL